MSGFARTRRGAWTLAALVAVVLLRPAPAAPTEGGQAVRLPILMYHHILDDPARHNDYTISADAFAADLDWLLSQGFQPVTVADLIAWCEGRGSLPIKPVMISFDDGYLSFYQSVWPILRSRNVPAVFSIIGIHADRYTETKDENVRYAHCSWPQLRELAESGLVELQNHSYDLHTYDEGGRRGAKRSAGEEEADYFARLSDDLGATQLLLRERCGVVAAAFTWPFGALSSEAVPLLQEMGFQAALTCAERVNLLTGDPAELFSLGRFNRPAGRTAREIFEAAGLGGGSSGVK